MEETLLRSSIGMLYNYLASTPIGSNKNDRSRGGVGTVLPPQTALACSLVLAFDGQQPPPRRDGSSIDRQVLPHPPTHATTLFTNVPKIENPPLQCYWDRQHAVWRTRNEVHLIYMYIYLSLSALIVFLMWIHKMSDVWTDTMLHTLPLFTHTQASIPVSSGPGPRTRLVCRTAL